MKKLGLVTVLFNSDEVLPDFFESIAIQTYKNFVLILIDNTPSEVSRSIVFDLAKKFNIVISYTPMSSNVGIAAGNNEGIKTAKNLHCDDIIILNNDICFDSSSLFERLVSISLDVNKAIIAPKIYFYNTNKLWYAGGELVKWKGTVYHFGYGQEDSAELNKASFTDYSPTCFLYVRGEIFDKVGLMDETYFVYADDLDFVYRAKQKHFSIWYEPSLFLYHKVSTSTGGLESDFGLRFNTRNKIYFIRKFLSFPYNLSAIVFTLIAAAHFAKKAGRTSVLSKVYKAFKEGYSMKITEDAII